MAWLMVALFFVSGATALMGEVVWMRMLGLVVGNTVWAATAAVAVWMGGMAVGAHLGSRLAPRTRRQLRWYGVAEGLIGLFYVLSARLQGLLLEIGTALGPDLGSNLVMGLVQRLLLAAAALLLPTVLMGLTLPLLVERLRGVGVTARVSLLYGINTLGAATGVFASAYLVLPWLGERGSLAVAGLCCALVAVVAILAEDRFPAGEPQVSGGTAGSTARGYLALVAAMGASALAAELVWVRVLVLHLGSRVYAFALLLGVYLLGIAVGSLVVWALARRISDPRRVLARVQVGLAIMLAVQLVALGHSGGLLGALAGLVQVRSSFVAVQGLLGIAVVVLFLPVTTLFGASFPLAVAADPTRRSAGAHAGVVAAANTVGGIVGALAAPFLLVPWIGCQRTLLVLAVVHLVVGLALVRTRPLIASATVVMVVVAGLAWVLPGDWVLRRAGSWVPGAEVELVSLEESLSATVLVKRYHERAGSWLSLELNGVNVAGSQPSLLAVQQLQGHLPLLQVASPRQVLHVGFGSGGTCWAVARHPVERIDVVEIAPEVLASADRYFPAINHHVLGDPRVRVILNDGRNYLLAIDDGARGYDAILSDSIHPVYAGNSTLYTIEYFHLCSASLSPGGVVSMWLPLYSLDRDSYLRILSAFHKVFPRTAVWYDVSTINEYTVVTGQLEPGPLEVRWQALADPDMAPSLAIAGVAGPRDLAADLLLGPEQVAALVADVPAHRDDLPFVEYTAGRVLARERTWYDNLRMLVAVRARSSPFAVDPVPWPEVTAQRDAALARNLEAVRGLLPDVKAEGGMIPNGG